MANLTSVGISSGVPNSGTGTVSTLDNLIGSVATPSASVLTMQGVSGGAPIPVSAAALPLPTGAATQTTLAAVLTALGTPIQATGGAVNATLQVSATTAIGKVDPNTIGNWGLVVSTQNSATPTNTSLVSGQFNTTPTTITSGNVSPLQLDANGNLLVNIKAGAGSGGTAIADEAAFTEGTTSITPIGGVFKTSQTALTTGQAGVVALSAAREMNTLGKIWDGTTTVPILAASSGAPAVTVPAIPVSLRDMLAPGAALQANSAPVTQAPTSFRIAVTPTVTASAYTAGNVLGGIMTFASALLGSPNASPTKWSAVLESICVKFKATAVTGEIDVAIFTASPLGGTYTDKTAPTFNTADAAKLVGVYALTVPESTLGTMTVYNLDGIGAVIDGASTSIFAVVTVKGTPTPASTTDVIVELGVLQG